MRKSVYVTVKLFDMYINNVLLSNYVLGMLGYAVVITNCIKILSDSDCATVTDNRSIFRSPAIIEGCF